MVPDHMITIQIWHLPTGLYPDLVLGVPSKEVDAADLQSELATFSELAEQNPRGENFFLGDIGGHTDQSMTNIVHSILDQSEHGVIFIID